MDRHQSPSDGLVAKTALPTGAHVVGMERCLVRSLTPEPVFGLGASCVRLWSFSPSPALIPLGIFRFVQLVMVRYFSLLVTEFVFVEACLSVKT